MGNSKMVFLFLLVSLMTSLSSAKFLNLEKFQVLYQWNYLNFTWPLNLDYSLSLFNNEYIPENCAPTGMKIYNNRIYLSLPRFRRGVPATLAYIPLVNKEVCPLLIPYPNWEMNSLSNCNNLQSVQSMEVDSSGVMWVLDGVRIKNLTRCPPKLLLLDLNDNGRILHKFEFPEFISLSEGGFLNDLVIDETREDKFAYITDNSNIDPGLIVFSLKKNEAWKLRDSTMFADIQASNFRVGNRQFSALVPIDGIALTPKIKNNNERFVLYCALTGKKLYALNTRILKDKSLINGDVWRKNVTLIGEKQSPGDGMVLDNFGNLYYTLLPFGGIGKWSIFEPFKRSRIIFSDPKEVIWPDGLAFDNNGFLYLISNNIDKYINEEYPLKLSNSAEFRIFRHFVGTKSYLKS